MLRVGMIGVGGVAGNYHSLYAEYPRSRLEIVFDSQTEAAQAVAAQHGAQLAESAEALVGADIDAVVISTPNFLHVEQTLAALRAGKHVLLQKPMTRNAAEAAELIEAARRAGRHLAIYMNSLDNPVMRDVKAMISAGTLGRIGGINAKLANGGAWRWRGMTEHFWRGSKQAVGGGSFAMLATHYINLCQWLLDAPITGVTARGTNLMSEHIEGDDIMACIAEFRGGVQGVIESAWCVKGEQFSIHGSEGSLSYIDNEVVTLSAPRAFEGEVVRTTTPGKREVITGCLAPKMGEWANPHNQHRQFIDAVLDGKPLSVPATRGLQDMLVLEAAYRSSETQRREAVEAMW